MFSAEKPEEIPPLPKTIDECLKLLEEKFKVVQASEMVPVVGAGYGTGGVSARKLLLECPFCKGKFTATERLGCFTHEVFPPSCPYCGYPQNLLDRLFQLRRQLQV